MSLSDLNYIDYILILAFLIGMYVGWSAGIFKSLQDSIVLFISTIISSIISKLVVKYLYQGLPFFNFYGKAEGIKSINIILWRVIIQLLLLAIILFIFHKLSIKLKIKQKILDTMVEINIVSRILGIFLYIPATILIMYNFLLFLCLPSINFSSFHESYFTNKILLKTPIVSSQNSNVFECEKYAVEQINNEDNTKDTYKSINDDILTYLVDNDMVSDDTVDKLSSKDKLVGTRDAKK